MRMMLKVPFDAIGTLTARSQQIGGLAAYYNSRDNKPTAEALATTSDFLQHLKL